jgi:hypothetical protein
MAKYADRNALQKGVKPEERDSLKNEGAEERGTRVRREIVTMESSLADISVELPKCAPKEVLRKLNVLEKLKLQTVAVNKEMNEKQDELERLESQVCYDPKELPTPNPVRDKLLGEINQLQARRQEIERDQQRVTSEVRSMTGAADKALLQEATEEHKSLDLTPAEASLKEATEEYEYLEKVRNWLRKMISPDDTDTNRLYAEHLRPIVSAIEAMIGRPESEETTPVTKPTNP